jgi:VPDSG-CTERM motif
MASSRGDLIQIISFAPEAMAEENVLFTLGETGAVVQGSLDQSGLIVDFTSTSGTGILTAPSIDRLEGGAGNQPFSQLTFSLDNGALFTAAVFEINSSSAAEAFTIAVNGPNNVFLGSGTSDIPGGTNFIRVFGTKGTQLSQISLSSTSGFISLQQMTISPAGTSGGPPPPTVPDSGTSVCLLGTALLSIIVVNRKWRRPMAQLRR